jgi:hypothetical protein
MNNVDIRDEIYSLTAGTKVTAFSERDDFLGEFAQLLRTRLSRLYPLILEKRAQQTFEHSLTCA